MAGNQSPAETERDVPTVCLVGNLNVCHIETGSFESRIFRLGPWTVKREVPSSGGDGDGEPLPDSSSISSLSDTRTLCWRMVSSSEFLLLFVRNCCSLLLLYAVPYLVNKGLGSRAISSMYGAQATAR